MNSDEPHCKGAVNPNVIHLSHTPESSSMIDMCSGNIEEDKVETEMLIHTSSRQRTSKGQVRVYSTSFPTIFCIVLLGWGALLCLLGSLLQGNDYVTSWEPLTNDPKTIEFQKQLLEYKSEKQKIGYQSESTSWPSRVLLLNRHFGVSEDIRFALRDFNLTLDEYNRNQLFSSITGLWSSDILSEYEADRSDVQQVADYICDMYDIVIVADVNADGRFLMQRILRSPQTCRLKKYVFGEFKMHRFHQLVRQLLALEQGPQIEWITNNPYENKYADIKLRTHIQFEMIRSSGYSPLTKEPTSSTVQNQVAIYDNVYLGCFYEYLRDQHGMNLTPIGHDYGGPKVLAKYKGYVEIPYQFYENIANGVVLILPSADFFYQLYKHRLGPPAGNFWGWHLVDFDLDQLGSRWYDHVDYYHQDFRDVIYYFNSFEELREMIEMPDIDVDNHRDKGISMFQIIRNESAKAWKRILFMSSQ